MKLLGILDDSIEIFNLMFPNYVANIISVLMRLILIYFPPGKYRHCPWSRTGCIIHHLDEIQKAEECKCELPCSNTVYEIEKLEDIKKEDLDDAMEISFISWPFTRYKRHVLFGWVDLFVAVGGIAGSFLGFSIFSAVEILYFFTLRVFCMTRREKNKLEKLHREYDNAQGPSADLSLDPYILKTSRKQENMKQKLVTNSDSHLPYLP